MGKTIKLKEAVNLIWETVKITEEQSTNGELPYLFIVGAGISAPEILSAHGIVQHCQEKVKELYQDDEEIQRIYEKSKEFSENSAGYYSYWFGQAYKNKIHRQQYLKSIISTARISTSNLLLAQILNNKKIATTVITPNFDNQLLKSLNLLGNYNVFSANNVLDNIALSRNSSDIQLMHVHGTYEFYDCCNLEQEIARVANETGIKSTAGTIGEFLKFQSPIVIGYSGWEDDVIMSKIKERLQYAGLPYGLIWFCFSNKDYEILPGWLKSSEDVFFVLPDIVSNEDKTADNKEEQTFLPAEDVFTALIAKFEFKDPKLFSNPIQYYIDLIDGFFPQNGDIFPVKAWKKRLDYIETHLGDIEKKIIELDSASARKDVIEITKILSEIDYSFISEDDLEHIINGIIIPSLSNKNRIEDKQDIYSFIEKILELFYKRAKDIDCSKMKGYLIKTIDFLSNYKREPKKDDVIHIYDGILEICRQNEEFEQIELAILGMKSDVSGNEEKILLQNQIIERGIKKIDNSKIARLVLVAINKQVIEQKFITEEQKRIMESVLQKHNEDVTIQKTYYRVILDFFDEDISMEMKIEDFVNQIIEKNISKRILLHARILQCKRQDRIWEKVDVAISAIEEYDYNEIDSCRECLDYAFLIKTIIIGKVKLDVSVEQRYIDLGIKLCYKEEGCSFVSKNIIDSLSIYIDSIDSQFEKRELYKKAVDICNRSRLYEDWAYFCSCYLNNVEKQEEEEFWLNNKKYRKYLDAIENMSLAIQEYVNQNIDKCKDMLLESSKVFDELFEGKYNPALINICFMARRGEVQGLEISVLEELNKITWMNNNAFLNINKALSYIMEGEWDNARKEIKKIDSKLLDAIEWWSQEQVVGRTEKDTVLLLLLLENKIDGSIKEINTEEFWQEIETKSSIPDEMKNEIKDIKQKYMCPR